MKCLNSKPELIYISQVKVTNFVKRFIKGRTENTSPYTIDIIYDWENNHKCNGVQVVREGEGIPAVSIYVATLSMAAG